LGAEVDRQGRVHPSTFFGALAIVLWIFGGIIQAGE